MKFFLVLVLIFNCLLGFSQTFFLKTGPFKIQEYSRQEKQLKSEPVRDSVQYYYSSEPDLEQPLIYARININFPIKPVVKYFFSLPDSLVRHINISIEANNSSGNTFQTGNWDNGNVIDSFNKQYNIFKTELVNLFGPSYPLQELTQKEFQGTIYWERYDQWENSNLDSQLYMMLDKKKKIFRIRAEINFKPFKK